MVDSFDRIADLYGAEYADKFDTKPVEQRWFELAIGRFPAGRPVLEVGAGPAQVSIFLASRGVPVVASDASVDQIRQAARFAPHLPLLAVDLARLPFADGTLGGIVAYYCLMYGPAKLLDGVFAQWRRALAVGGLALIVVHAGEGVLHTGEFRGRPTDINLVRRDPDDLCDRLTAAGFAIETRAMRRPVGAEAPSDRLFVMARRLA